MRLHLERPRDRESGTKTAWCADYWRGECLGTGWWWRESKLAANSVAVVQPSLKQLN
jgi:hypothetical protein